MIEQDIIKNYLGIPYLHQGRDKVGLDCYGLIIAIYANFGINLFDVEEDYAPDWSWNNKNYFLENAHKDWQEITTPCFLDVVLFRNGKEVINHAGVMLDNDRFINTCKAGTVICRLSDSVWKTRVVGFYRHRGLNINGF